MGESEFTIPLLINLVLMGLFTILLIVLAIDEAKQEKKRKKESKPREFKKSA